jgi:hypothetical protein
MIPSQETERERERQRILLEKRLELDVGELDIEKVEEEANLFGGKNLPEDGTLLQASR